MADLTKDPNFRKLQEGMTPQMPFSPTGGAGFLPASQVPVPATRTTEDTIAGDIQTAKDKIGGFLQGFNDTFGAYGERAQARREAQFPGGDSVVQNISDAFTSQAQRAGGFEPPQPETPSMFTDQAPLGQMPSANIGQLPNAPAPFSTEGAAQVNPMMAPQMDYSQIPSDRLPFSAPASEFIGPDITLPSGEVIKGGNPAAVQPQVPNIGGTITRDATGQVFSSTPQGNALINSPMTQTPAQTQQMAQDTQAGIDASRAAYEQRVAAANPAQVAGETPIGYGETVQANIAAGRPANVSAGTVQVAQREAMQREAEMAADRAAKAFEDQLGYAGRPIAETDKMVAAYRANVLNEAMGKIDPNAKGGTGEGGLTAYQRETLARKDRDFAAGQAEKAAEVAAVEKETAQARQKSIERMDSQLSFLKKSAIEMAGLQDWSTEGFAGWFAEKLPLDTSAAQVNRLATSFQGNAFLRSIIDSKSLGATFGALSDSEGNKITAAETTLMDTKQGNEARMRAAKQIIDTIESAKARAMKEQGSGSQQQSPPSGNVPSVEGVTITAIS